MDVFVRWIVSVQYGPVFVGVLVLLVVMVFVVAVLQGREVSFWPPRIGETARRIGVEMPRQSMSADEVHRLDGYPRSQHPTFFADVPRMINESENVILIATGLNMVWEKNILDLLLDRAAAGKTRVTICMGNPFSPHVEERLVEEEMRDNRPPVGREGIIKNVKTLVERLELAGNPPFFRVLLFEHYPTFATLIFDKDIFVYPYAYQILGNESPLLHFQNDGSAEAKFFLSNAERILHDAIPASDVVMRKRRPTYHSERWVAAAVYVIPDEDNPLYRFGTKVLGYDIARRRECDEVIDGVTEYAGEARNYGFHLTLADALLFANNASIERIAAELRVLCSDLHRFSLSNFRIADRATENDIVLLCDDVSGMTELIHCELIHRVYRMAISSNYVSGRTRRRIGGANQERARLMVSRYGAPYINRDYSSHLSLASPAPGNAHLRRELFSRLSIAIENERLPSDLDVDEICLVMKNESDSFWYIKEKFALRD